MLRVASPGLWTACLIAGSVPLAVPTGCAPSEEPVRASIVTSFSLPRGVLDKAKQLDLRVLEGKTSCDVETGIVGTDPATKEVVKTTLGQQGCPQNVKFCGNISVPKSAEPRVFEAKARDGGEVLAVGCASVKIEQDAVPVSIKMLRFLEPSVCGDGKLQPMEQCEPGNTEVCDDKCQSKEIVLTIGASGNKTSTGKAGDKTDPFFVWPQGSEDDGRFVAFFSDKAVPGGGGTVDVGLRVMSDSLAPVTTPPALASGSIFLPSTSTFPPDATPLQQSLPQAALLGGKYYVVFQDDSSQSLDIHLRVVTKLFSAEGGELAVNGGNQGEPGIQTTPAISASADRLFVVWQDQAAGTIVGRTVNNALTLGNQNQISTGNGNAVPQLAVTSKGWVTIWKSDTGIKLRAVDGNGTPSGSELTVNESGSGAENPRVASLPDGRFAVVWSKGGDVFFQRYDERGAPIGGDQLYALNDVLTEGEQSQPTIAATSAAGGSYVVAWHDGGSGQIRARFLGGSSGFLLNSVNGQLSEFQASRADGHERVTPVAISGGREPFVAIGWEDKSSDTPGIIVRRFPLPRE